MDTQAPDPPAIQARGFPFLLILRWLIGVAIALHGILGLYLLAVSWSYMADRAIIAPDFSPYRYLPAALLKVATGVLLIMRRKIVVIVLVAWIAAFSSLFVSSMNWSQLPAHLYFSWMEQLVIVAFVALLWVKGRLR